MYKAYAPALADLIKKPAVANPAGALATPEKPPNSPPRKEAVPTATLAVPSAHAPTMLPAVDQDSPAENRLASPWSMRTSNDGYNIELML